MTECARARALTMDGKKLMGTVLLAGQLAGAVSFLVHVNYHILMHSSTARLHPYICIYSPIVYQSLYTRGHLECGALLY